MMCYLRLLLPPLVTAFLFTSNNINAQQLAFPTAEGAGKFTSGGRGSIAAPPKIYEVTTLTDDATSANTPGTLRYACTNNSPAAPNRIIVFRVAGTIHLYTTLTLNRANTTIAGQTAPGDGICIADYPVSIGANNMIIRYLRFRLGDKNQNLGMINGSGDGDAFGDNGNGRQKLMLDHCTASWSDDEAFTVYKGDSVTIQWCIISEPLNYSYHFETGDADFEQHAYGGIWGGKHATFHHNLIAHIKGRAPRFDGIRNIPADSGDFRNNVIYDWVDYNTNGGEGGAYNIVNNYYKYGPNTLNTSTSGVNRKNMLINPFKQTSPAIPYGQYYLTGNYCDNSTVVTNDNWLGAAFSGGSFNDSTASKALVPFNCININMQTALDAYNSVLANAGCVLPHRDTLDQRIVNDVINRTGRIIDVQGGYPHGTPYSTSQTAWPTLASGTPQVDTDHDGMPDVWETQRGLNPNDASDANGYISTSGYSNVENYLNGDSIVAPGVLNACVNANKITSNNSGKWLNANDTSYSGYLSPSYLAATDSMNVVASILDNGNFGTFNVSYYTSSTQRYDQFAHPYLNRNITIAPTGGIASPVTVRIYFSNAEYDALRVADPSIVSLTDLRIVKISGSSCVNTLSGSTQTIVPTASGVYGTYQKGYYLEFTTSSFSTFFVTSSVAAGPLPIHLVSFNASYNSGAVKAVWSTVNEISTHHFVVERSSDGQNFSSVGTVNAKNLSTQNDYLYNDVNPLDGLSYYRLKIVDRDGSAAYSKTVSVNIISNKKIKVTPDPALNSITVSYPKANTAATIRVINADGKQVMKRNVIQASTLVTLDVSGLSKGIYGIIYNDGANIQTGKFVKQ